MKYVVILADGCADYPLESLGGKTPLMAAETPNIDALCAKSRLGRLITVPEHMHPGSEVANLAVLGYDVEAVFEGRGVLEAAGMGVELDDDDLAMRCNLISLDEKGAIKNHSAGHISTEESQELVGFLNKQWAGLLESGAMPGKLYAGVSYRHLFVLKHGAREIECTPPHDVPGTPYKDVMIKPSSNTPEARQTAELLNRLILKSQEILPSHPVNQDRTAAGKDPANSVWFWSAGKKPAMKSFKELYGKTGAIISAVDLIFGIGTYAGFQKIHIPGATGLYNTDYEGKARAAIGALGDVDFVYLHVEASDEAGHEGDEHLKVKTLEYLDRRLVKPIVEAAEKSDEPVSIAILPDHPTPCALRTHTRDPVPFMIYKPGVNGDGIHEYNEESAVNGSYGLLNGDGFIKALFAEG